MGARPLVIVLAAAGQSEVQISGDFSVIYSDVGNLFKQFKKTEPIERKLGQGFPRDITIIEDRCLSLTRMHQF